MKLKYAVVYERSPNNYNAYAPDVPGCFSSGKTWRKMQSMIREALAFHIEGLIEFGEPVPEPRMSMKEAMAHHLALLSEPIDYDDPIWFDQFGIRLEFAPTLETTFGMVEVEVKTESSPASSSTQAAQPIGSAP